MKILFKVLRDWRLRSYAISRMEVVEEISGNENTKSEKTPLLYDVYVQQKYIKQWPHMPILDKETNLQEQAIEIKQEYEKYRTKLRKWRKRDNYFKMFARVLIGFTMLGATVMSVVAGINVSPLYSYIAAGLAAVGALKEPLEKLFITDCTTKKRIKYMNKCNIIRDGLSDMYLQSLAARKDTELDSDETKKFQKAINDIHAKLANLDTDHINDLV